MADDHYKSYLQKEREKERKGRSSLVSLPVPGNMDATGVGLLVEEINLILELEERGKKKKRKTRVSVPQD